MTDMTEGNNQATNETATATITEKNYPITSLWIFKAPIVIVIISVIGLVFGIWFPYLVIALVVFLISNPLIRSKFHYTLDSKYFVVDQGVIKKVHRSLPYGVIQNVFVKQDIFDRIFGLSTLSVENAASAGDLKNINKQALVRASAFGGGIAGLAASSSEDRIGASGNKVNIPGLKKADAELLKQAILQKMKENPIHDSGSGL